MSKEKQTEFERNEISEIIAKNFKPNDEQYDPSDFEWSAHCVQMAGYRKQSEGEWEWFEEWNPSTTEHPRECDECGWRCGECKTALADIVGGYWDNPDEKPNLNFCPNCGAKMKGGAE